MFIILRNRSLKPFNSLRPNLLLLLLQSKSPISPFSSLKPMSESNPNSTSEKVKALFRSHGITEIQISKIIKLWPKVLSAKHEVLAPKFDFLLSIGIPKTDLPKVLSNKTGILWTSLEKQLIPCHNSLKTLLVNDENVVKVVLRYSRILCFNFDRCISPKINLLTEIGVPKTQIGQMLLQFPSSFGGNHVKFKEAVEAAIRMGFNPENSPFTTAVGVLCSLSKTTWDRKVMIYKSWGFSDDEVRIAFRVYPQFMSLSEEKITEAMNVFLNEMGRKAADVARSSYILGYSIENRIKPRCRVIKLLISKGYLKETISLGYCINVGEEKFLEKFVSKYEDEVPELLTIYRERQSI